MAITLTQARTALENYKKDITDVNQTVFIEWCNFVNRWLYRKLCMIDPERFISSSTVSVVSGTSTYALPATFRSMDVLYTGLYEVDVNGNDTARRLTRTGFGSSTRGFYISGTNVIFTPTPQKAETFRLRFLPKPPTFTSMSDYFTIDKLTSGAEIIPEEYLELLRDDLARMYSLWDEDQGMEAFEDARFTRSLDEYLDTIRKEGRAISIPDFSSSYL